MAIGGVFEMLPTEGKYLFILCFTIFHCIVQLLSSDGERSDKTLEKVGAQVYDSSTAWTDLFLEK